MTMAPGQGLARYRRCTRSGGTGIRPAGAQRAGGAQMDALVLLGIATAAYWFSGWQELTTTIGRFIAG